MKKLTKIFILVLSIFTLNAKDGFLDINAKHFEANKQKNILYFDGDVVMHKNQDILKCQKLVINTKQSTEDSTKIVPKDYTATGDVFFHLLTNDNNITAKGDKIYYSPDKQLYIITGNAFLEDAKTDKKIEANKIYLDEKTGHTKMDGDTDTPVKFHLKLDDTKK